MGPARIRRTREGRSAVCSGNPKIVPSTMMERFLDQARDLPSLRQLDSDTGRALLRFKGELMRQLFLRHLPFRMRFGMCEPDEK